MRLVRCVPVQTTPPGELVLVLGRLGPYPVDMVASSHVLGASERPLRRVEYERLVQLGMFGRDERLELVAGHLVTNMTPQTSKHAGTVQRLTKLLMTAVLTAGDAEVRVQLPLALSDVSEPEPDLAVVPPGDYLDAHPDRALLVIEVADTSLEFDRGPKAELYADAGVPEYWLVNLRDRQIECSSQPVDGRYETQRTFRSGDSVAATTIPGLLIGVDDFVT